MGRPDHFINVWHSEGLPLQLNNPLGLPNSWFIFRRDMI